VADSHPGKKISILVKTQNTPGAQPVSSSMVTGGPFSEKKVVEANINHSLPSRVTVKNEWS